MSLILKKINEIDPNNSDAIKETLTIFFQNLLKQVSQDCKQWLHALEDVVSRFPKFCVNHRITIETFIVNLIDSSNYNYVIGAAKCAHLLQQVKTANPKHGWKQQMILLCYAVQKLSKSLFSTATTTSKNSLMGETSQTPLTELLQNPIKVTNEDAIDKRTILLTRLKNIYIFIQAMLVEIYPAAKPIQPQLILDSILQIVSVTNANKDKIKEIAMLKCEAFRTLDAVIVCLGSNLIPYSPLVFRMVMQSLRWSSDDPDDSTKAVRQHAYTSLRRWLMVLHVYKISDSRGSLEDELTTHIMNDITPPKKTVELTMGPEPTRNMSKKAQKKLKARQIQDSSLTALMPKKNKIIKSEVMNNEIAIVALDCTEALFIVCGIFLKPTTHKIFQERLVRECFNLSLYSGMHGLYLLRALEAARKGSGLVPPPTQYCLELYAEHTNSVHTEIAAFCSKALLDIRMHLHCAPPSLNFALNAVQENLNQKKKKISQRNRAVLESLLGRDRVPSNEIEEDIITIPDEPVNKKPRLEDEPDKISLSSESISSVEISDDSEVDDVQEIHQTENDSESEALEANTTRNTSQHDDEISVAISDTNSQDAIESSQSRNNQIMENLQNEDTVQRGVHKAIGSKSESIENSDSIYEAPTQIPFNNSNDTIDGEDRPHSLEIGYDYPKTGNENVPILEKMDDANLPSTNETDDIQITCGQVLESSQEVDTEKKSSDVEMEQNSPKVNGIETSEDVGTDINVQMTVTECDSTSVVTEKNSLSVEDMLADFVDEVIDDA